MACPFFLPSARIQESWEHAPRLPLGGLYRGTCLSQPGEPFEPPEAALRELCNCGYARGHCNRFPGNGAPDAVRFSIRQDDGRLMYVLEKDYAPAEFGIAEDLQMEDRPALAAQARVFTENYFKSGKREAAAVSPELKQRP